METQSRWAVNVTSGLIHAMKEFRATEIIIGLHQRQHLSDIYYGRVAQTLIAGIDRQISVLRCTVPFNTLRRIHVLVPSKAQFEVGFSAGSTASRASPGNSTGASHSTHTPRHSTASPVSCRNATTTAPITA